MCVCTHVCTICMHVCMYEHTRTCFSGYDSAAVLNEETLPNIICVITGTYFVHVVHNELIYLYFKNQYSS